MFTEETQSEIRDDIDSELHESRNMMVPSPLEELASFVDQLKPIEKYALNFLELFHTLNDQKNQKVSKEFVCEGLHGVTEIMPLWTPLVPPENHDDVYTDSVVCLMYSSTPIPESQLPPLFVRRGNKRQRTDLSSSGERKKNCHRRLVVPPPSLFDRVTPRILKTRQKSKAQKTLLLVKQQACFARPLSARIKTAADVGRDSPAWLTAEDLTLLKAVKQLRAPPLNLAIVSPAQTANWDFVSDLVNSCNYVYRSPKQCQNRYITAFAGPGEKNIGGYPLRVRQAYAKDHISERTQIYMNHFELMTMTARKRSSSNRFLTDNYEKLLPVSEGVSICAEPMTMQEKVLTEEQIAPQLQEQQPGQKQEEEQTVEQIQSQCRPQGETQASGGALSPAIAAFQQVPVVPTMPAQLEPTAPGWFFQAEAFDSSSCNGHSDSCAVLFDDSAYIRFSSRKFQDPMVVVPAPASSPRLSP
ncbi:E1A-binding protein p400-like isoform X2 [Opisthocomus hoazin]|uniref:E1A-binding protein p400-like isoform X2 n=1 Tax=Opisthocomus hoazin TaxID=30419 RepID=UPI003F52F14C